MKKEIRLYNMMFPVWLLVVFPVAWIPVIISNFLIDSAVLLIYLKIKNIDGKKEIWKKSIIRIFLFGILGDIAGGLLMVGETFIFDNIGMHGVSMSITYNPWGNIIAFLYTVMCMFIASFVIYKLDKKFALRKTALDDSVKRKIALIFAVFTTPILFLMPSYWIY